jgi:hypothetical protein
MDPYRENTIANGFKEAADAVIAHASENPRHPDQFLFPVGFLYRHALEVKLKRICRMAATLHNVTPPSGLLHQHGLAQLWRFAKPLIVQTWPKARPEDVAELDFAERVIDEFDQIDSNAQAFRYVTDRKGKENLTAFPDQVTLEHIQQTISTVYELLDGIDMGLEDYLSALLESQVAG